MAPSRKVGIIITFASKPSFVIVAIYAADNVSNATNIMIIDIRNGMCLFNSSYGSSSGIYCDFDEINNQLTISNREGFMGFAPFSKAIVIPLYSKDLP